MAKNESRLQRHRSWQKHAEKELAAGRKPVKFKDWELESVYFKGMAKQTPESRLKAAGVDWEKDKPSARMRGKK
jgi:hypothetical protein